MIAGQNVSALDYVCHFVPPFWSSKLFYLFLSPSLEISLIKREEGPLWPELIIGDAQGEYIMDPAQNAAVAEHLMHLTSDEMVM